MSERFLKYETEAENSLVDENGVLQSDKVSDLFLYLDYSDGTVIELSLDKETIPFNHKGGKYSVGEEMLNKLANLIRAGKLRFVYQLYQRKYYSNRFTIDGMPATSIICYAPNGNTEVTETFIV